MFYFGYRGVEGKKTDHSVFLDLSRFDSVVLHYHTNCWMGIQMIYFIDDAFPIQLNVWWVMAY